MPVNTETLREEAVLLANRPGFKASKKWLTRFLQRHKVKFSRPEAFTSSRAQAQTEDCVRQHFKVLGEARDLVLEKSGATELYCHQFANLDEKPIVTRKSVKCFFLTSVGDGVNSCKSKVLQ